MSISKAVVKLAAAALVVAGGVGMAWAQAPIFSASPVATGAQFGGSASESMRAAYEVKKEAEIEVTGLNPTKDDFFGVDPKVSKYTDNGNLGWLRVKTNSSGWDVAFTTAFGGKLATTEKTLDSTQTGYDFAAGKPIWEYHDVYGPLTFLMYTSKGGTGANGILGGNTASDLDTVQLVVGIGMSERVDNGVKALKGIKYGQYATPYNTPLVAQAELTATQSTADDGSAISGTAVSFAKVLTAASTGVTDPGAGKRVTVGGVPVYANATITNGFGPTSIPNNASNTDADGWEYFYVNVGLPDLSASGNVIGGNVDGIYEETFTFTLLASF